MLTRPTDDLSLIADVTQLYALVLGRVADRPGLLHHVKRLASGESLASLTASLFGTDEARLVWSGLEPRRVAGTIWTRSGAPAGGFEAAWLQAPDLAHFVSALALGEPMRRGLALKRLFPDGVDPALDDVYRAWGYRLWSAENEQALSQRAHALSPLLRLAGPVIRLELAVTPHDRPSDLDATLSSLAGQIYGRWRLLLCGRLPDGFVLPDDPRIATVAPARSVRPSLYGRLAAGDTLSPCCLSLFAYASLRRPDGRAWRCDEDRRHGDGMLSSPMLSSQMLATPDRPDLGLVLSRRRETPRRRAGDGPLHLPVVLLHRRLQPPAPVPEIPPTACDARVSVVIATRDRAGLLSRCIDSLRLTTACVRPEIVLVDNGSTAPDALALLDRLEREGCVVLRRPGRFNWSALNNDGVRAAAGEVVVLLNNDVECIAADWLSVLLRACDDPAVGIAGAMLLYADGRVQHAGVLVGPGPAAVHRWSDGAESGSRRVTAVTGACMAFRRSVFDRLGGLDAASLPVTWNDLDFCLRAREAGFEVRLECDSVLRHDELGTRTPDTAAENHEQLVRTHAYVARRHRRALRRDRSLHPLLTLQSGGRLLDVDASGRLWRLLQGGGMN